MHLPYGRERWRVSGWCTSGMGLSHGYLLTHYLETGAHQLQPHWALCTNIGYPTLASSFLRQHRISISGIQLFAPISNTHLWTGIGRRSGRIPSKCCGNGLLRGSIGNLSLGLSRSGLVIQDYSPTLPPVDHVRALFNYDGGRCRPQNDLRGPAGLHLDASPHRHREGPVLCRPASAKPQGSACDQVVPETQQQPSRRPKQQYHHSSPMASPKQGILPLLGKCISLLDVAVAW